MRLAYVIDQPELNGGNKVIIEHAQLLADRGHEVHLLANGPRPAWIAFAVPWTDASREAVPPLAWDLVVGTYWTSFALADRLGLSPLAHFCQGYEASFPHLESERREIEAVYERRLPTLTVTDHLARLLAARHGRACRTVRPARDPGFAPRRRWRPRRAPWIVVPGIFEAALKGVPTALAAVAELRRRGVAARLLRLSTHPLTEAEAALLPPDRTLAGVATAVVARELPRVDLLLFASRPEEGFGLPLLEAMSAGVPVVASDIPSAREIGDGAFAFVPPGDGAAMAEAAWALLSSPRRWRRARRRGWRELGRFDRGRVAATLDEAVRWAAGEAARHPALVAEAVGAPAAAGAELALR